MTTRARNEYEQNLIKEIRKLPATEIPKILKLVNSLKTEILEQGNQKGDSLKLFWRSFGSWKDKRSPEKIIGEIYESRKSNRREVKL